VAGAASYAGSDWLEQRSAPSPHLHQGADIVASEGTPVIASGPGTVRVDRASARTDPDGGNSIRLTLADGTEYYYAHLSSFARSTATGATVAQGDILGSVGSTGDATGPHLHFEIRPRGGGAVDPTPYLDRWLAQANATVRALGSSSGEAGASLSALSLQRGAAPRAARSARATRAATGSLSARLSPISTRRSSETDPVPVLAVASFGLGLAGYRLQRRRKGVTRGAGITP
jgi:hypothetical protein